MDKKFHIVALNPKGEVVMDETTKQSWSVSELQVYLDRCKIGLHTGRIHDLTISAIDG